MSHQSPVTSHQSPVKDLSFSVLSALLLALPFFNGHLWMFAWFGFVPFFLALENKSKFDAFLLSYITGIIFWACVIYWLVHVTLVGLILVVFYLALYFGLFGILFTLCALRYALCAITLSIAWVLLEYIRSYALTGFPWALLGYSQYLNLPIIQIADLLGVWGVSFLVMMVNVAVYAIIDSRFTVIGHRLSIIGILKRFSATILCLALALIYGYYQLNRKPTTDNRQPITVSVIQGNIPQNQKWDANFRGSILERYEALTREAAKDRPDLIIWPETSVPGLIDEEPQLLARILSLAKMTGIPILIGAISISNSLNYNSAILISKKGKVIEQYDKLHLVPFGEYVPFEKTLPFLRDLIGVPIGDFSAGRDYTVFKTPRNFSVLICFEDIFPELSKRFVNKGAEFLVNITNDAWFTPLDAGVPACPQMGRLTGFMRSSAPYQHAQASVFRAVENRVPVVRAANTGLSCFIDPTGRIYDKVAVDNKDIFVVGYRTREISLKVKTKK